MWSKTVVKSTPPHVSVISWLEVDSVGSEARSWVKQCCQQEYMRRAGSRSITINRTPAIGRKMTTEKHMYVNVEKKNTNTICPTVNPQPWCYTNAVRVPEFECNAHIETPARISLQSQYQLQSLSQSQSQSQSQCQCQPKWHSPLGQSVSWGSILLLLHTNNN